jgi:hypothetical protein
MAKTLLSGRARFELPGRFQLVAERFDKNRP